jgi:hypothetical protein
MQHFLLSSSLGGQSRGVSEMSKEKLKVCPLTDDDFNDACLYMFRSKIAMRLYVPDFARANWYFKKSFGLSHRVAIARK